MSAPTRADECSKLLRILSDAPVEGVSMQQIQEAAARDGLVWSLVKVNDLLCAVRPQITHEKARVRNQKVTRYRLRSHHAA